MNIRGPDSREKRSILNNYNLFHPAQHNISNYSTDSRIEKKSEIKFDDSIISKIGFISLKKNLADTVIPSPKEKEMLAKMAVVNENYHYQSHFVPENLNISQSNTSRPRGDYKAAFTGFFGIIMDAISGAMFAKRPKSPDVQYFDCFDTCDSQEMPPPSSWQSSKIDELNKTLATDSCEVNDSMNDSGAAVAQCEKKLNAVRSLLRSEFVNKPSKSSQPSRLRVRRPKREFVQPGSVHESTVEEFDTEEFVNLANEECIEYFGVSNNINSENCEVHAAKMKIEIAPEKISADIIKSLPISDKKSVISISENCNLFENSNSLQDTIRDIETTDIVKVLPQIIETELKTEFSNPTDEVISTLETSKTKERKVVDPVLHTIENGNSNIVIKQETKSRCQKKLQTTPFESSTNLIAAEPKTSNLKTESLPNISITESIKEVITKKPPKPVPIPKPKDKKFKNPHRLTDKKMYTKCRKMIQEDMLFAQEIGFDIFNHSLKVLKCKIRKDSLQSLDTSSAENSPMSRSLDNVTETPIGSVEKDYFDEMKGRFHSASITDSEDSFQIVFAESPTKSRFRKPSDCDSEDSFIVFEDSPENCYTSNDVFGDSDGESDMSETDSELSDSDCEDICKLVPYLSRTIGDLTDDSLYENEQNKEETTDEVDCSVRTFEEIPSKEVGEAKPPGLLIDDLKKLRRKNQPPKKVSVLNYKRPDVFELQKLLTSMFAYNFVSKSNLLHNV